MAQFISSDIELALSAVTPVATQGGAFWIKQAISVDALANNIKYCYLGDLGGGYYLE